MYVYIPVCTICVAQNGTAARINNIEFNDNNNNNGS